MIIMKRKILNLSAVACSYLLVGGVGISHAVWDTSNAAPDTPAAGIIGSTPSGAVTYTALAALDDLGVTPTASTDSEIVRLVETTNPTNAGVGAAVSAGNAVAGANSGSTSGRMAALRSEKIYAKMGLAPEGPAGSTSSANALKAPGMWGVAVGTWGDQDEIDNDLGFDYDTYGLMFGYDHKMSDSWLLGVNFGYTNSDVDSGINANTDIDTFNIGIYSSNVFGNIYIDYGFMYSYNDGDSDRTIIDGVNSYNASGDPDSDVYTFYVQSGYEITSDNMIITPLLGFMYSTVDADGYTESDQGSGLGLTIKDSNDYFFSSTLGVKSEYFLNEELHLKGRLTWTHEYSGDLRHTTKARFNVAGATFFDSDGIDLDKDHFNIGIGVKYHVSDQISLDADYDYDFADDFDSHTGTLSLKYYF